MRFSTASIVLIAALGVTSPSLADEKPWREARSPHFRIITNGGERDGRHLAHAFEQMRPAETIPADVLGAGVHIAEGAVKSVVCEDHKMAVTLEQSGQVLTFRQPRYVLGVSDTFWEGQDHFTPCFHNIGVRGVVRYKAAADKSYAGDIVSLGFRDDFPPGPSPVVPNPAAAAAPHN
jgi:hypothetical protein